MTRSASRADPWLRKPIWLAMAGDDYGDDDRLLGSGIGGTHNNNKNADLSSGTSSDHGTFDNLDQQGHATIHSRNTHSHLKSDEQHCDYDHRDVHDAIRRHMSLFDLVCVGLGGTIGSGIFVLCGLIAKQYAGPATFLSWLIAGVTSLFSGMCYAELAGRIPTAGSSYAYAYIAMGELPAVIAAACLTLEYMFSSAAVARSWGDKVTQWISSEDNDKWILKYLEPGHNINVCAFIICVLSTFLLAFGVKESKLVTNFFTTTKVCLVAFMGIGGLFLFKPHNVKPLIPPEFGMAGVLRGATSSFFGYIGYDEIACLAGEAKNPQVNVPNAIIIVVVLVTVLYMFAAFSLTGMQPYASISEVSGFPEAFRYNDIVWAAELTAFGEVFTMPIVVLIGLLAQPRLQYALAYDGLLPQFFAKIDESGNLRNGVIAAGSLMTIIASCVPFEYLDDFISAGILVAFSITANSLLIMRFRSPSPGSNLLNTMLLRYNGLALLSAIVLSKSASKAMSVVGCILISFAILCSLLIKFWCPQESQFGGNNSSYFFSRQGISDENYFRVPFIPFIPCIAIFMNYYLIAQLSLSGILILVSYISVTVLFYFLYGAPNSVGNNGGWSQHHQSFQIVGASENDETFMERGISLPPVKNIGDGTLQQIT